MFHNQRKRLLRKERWTADDLAQELWAMFGPDVPLEHRGPVTLVQDGEQPAITFRNFGDGDSVFSFRRGDVVSNTVIEGDNIVTNVVGGGSSTGTTFPGKVVSQSSGNNYLVDTYPSGLSGSAVRVTVRQLSIASGEVIPADTWTLVAQTSDGSYYMQVPVWG